MNDTAYTQSPEQLAQAALERIRTLCKGNGVKAANITLVHHNITQHTLNAGTYLELKPITTEKEAPGKIVVGTLVGSREEATKQIDQAMISAARDPTVKAQITATLLARPDQGFGLGGQPIPLEFLKRDYTYHDGCQTCRGSGQAPCVKCHGKRIEPCIKCSARGLMFCPFCRGTGMLQGVKCQKCFGTRYMPCDMCRKTGMMPCRTCHGQGHMKCATCGGQGWRSHILSLLTTAMTYFEYDAKSIPKGAADMIETGAPQLAKDKKIKLTGRVADDKENAIGASYEVSFPYGDAEFSIGKKDIKAGVFGYQADLVNLPNILDKLVQKGVEELEEAAGDVGSVADKIKSATRYRLIAQAFLYTTRTTPENAAEQLLKKYDAGLSVSMAEKIVLLAENTMSRITKKPRTQGLMAGLVITALIAAAYYIAPLRSAIADMLPDPKFDVVLDILPVLLGGFITPLMVKMMAAGSVRTALGHLLPENEKKTFAPKTGNAASIGYGAAILFSFAAMEFCALMSKPAPYWYEYLRNLILP